MSNSSNFFGDANGDLGPAKIIFDPVIQTGDTGQEISLGDTQGMTFRFTVSKTDLTSDQDGTEAFNRVSTGELCELEINLVKTSLEILQAVTQGFDSYTGGSEGASFAAAIGQDDLSIALPLELIKIEGGVESADNDDKLIIPNAAPMTEAELVYDAGTQRVYNVKFRCYKSTTYVRAVDQKPLYAFLRSALNKGHVSVAS